MPLATPFPLCIISSLLLVGEAALETGTKDYYLIAAIGALASVTIYLHRANQKAAADQAKADTERFNSFVGHQEEMVAKIDEERDTMTTERNARIKMLMDMVEKNAVANEKQAAAANAQAAALDRLTAMISERVAKS